MNAQFQQGSKVYMSLFREADNQVKYDEAELKAQLKAQGVNVGHFAVLKLQLFKLILKSLRTFHEGKSHEQQILSMLSEAGILKNKGFYRLAIKHLDKAKTIAYHYEMHNHIFEILNRLTFLHIEIVLGRSTQRLEELTKEMENLKESTYREADIRAAAYKMSIILASKPLRHPDTIAAVKVLESLPSVQGIASNDTFFARLFYFVFHAQVNRAKGNFTAADSFHRKILEIWGKYPHVRSVNNRLYKAHITNYLNNCLLIENYDDFDAWLKIFENIKDNNFDEEAGSFKDFYHIKLLYLLNNAKFEEALGIVPEVERGMEAYKQKISKSREMTFRFNVFITFFINEKFSEALDWLHTMELDTKIESKADLRALARIMKVIVHYELGHVRILDDMRTSVYRKLKRQDQLHEFEQTMLTHIRLLEKAENEKAKEPCGKTCSNRWKKSARNTKLTK
ncbi:MAG: hypothetical protein K9J37_22240 [Saprospiraceae bacterium]|nr:hypothetical protein [Saprospiraceae bacterium]MCF8252643.1 hypothetical protein [Saprospiraceae bacterium]MCF8314216.1 hypothetical protein [Saprospiraceae bacterium]MCF8443032.1 hypothetical protein [Saprospiraceae bacterium]